MTILKLPNPERLDIVFYPDPVLKMKCTPVTDFSPALAGMAGRMLELMHHAPGVGLAAPQVGIPIRLFVCNPTGEPEDDAVYVNPVLTDLEGGEEAEEGCLSLPSVSTTMRRAQKAVIHAVDLHGHDVEAEGKDLIARIWQHETDHLDGRLIIDNMSTSDEITNRRLLKQLREDYAASHK